ncbi:MAG: hypothetical protein M1829_003408 [Trizodia sp. TS-e1964]|nr:MAG: hypothetical protein M1829_003408 [Trizodia sp. TS-e1964]
MSTESAKRHTILDSTFPVLVPKSDALLLDDAAFSKHIQSVFSNHQDSLDKSVVELTLEGNKSEGTEDDGFTLVTDPDNPMVESVSKNKSSPAAMPKTGNLFMDALIEKGMSPIDMDADNKTFTAKGGKAYRSTNNHSLDLFSELQNSISGPRLRELLENSWKDSPINTLKIIWNARSIHLGKGDKESFYRCLGWLKASHPQTLLKNLPWVCRPIIEKKAEKKEKEDDKDMIIIEKSNKSLQDYDVLNGVAHGYWKDLLNILVLDTQSALNPLTDPRTSLNVDNKIRKNREVVVKTAEERRASAKKSKHEKEAQRHELFLERFNDTSYAALHNAIARIFANQLRKDLTLIQSKSPDLRRLSLAGKWAPSLEGFHDQHTFIASSIAELLYPPPNFPDTPQDGTIAARTAYLKKARAKYQQATLSTLRKALSVVEGTISSHLHPFPSPEHPLNYSTVPSVAMNNYMSLFASKDTDGYSQYLINVSSGKSQISGATLQPGLMVKQARERKLPFSGPEGKKKKAAKALSEEAKAKLKAIANQASDLQWRSLVQRIKDSGKLESSIAVCDISGSMYDPVFSDKTTPVDHAIGLSLIISEVGSPPFQGAFISFSETPKVHTIDTSSNSSFNANVEKILSSTVGYATNFAAVFLDLILPLALENKIKPEDMVKRVFVFSDMQFDVAENTYEHEGIKSKWQTAFQVCTDEFNKNGYQLPELVFWNLAAGGWGGKEFSEGGILPKPVTDEVPGAAIVSGYGQGMIKVFLDQGGFDVPEPETEKMEIDVANLTGDGTEKPTKSGSEKEEVERKGYEPQKPISAVPQKRTIAQAEESTAASVDEKTDDRLNAVDTMMRALSHKAYSMLEIVD